MPSDEPLLPKHSARSDGDDGEAARRAEAELLERILSEATEGASTFLTQRVVAEASTFAAMEEDCAAGVSAACDALSQEEEAKRVWLSRLDVPSWGATAAAVSEVSALVKINALVAQAEALIKAAERLDSLANELARRSP